MPRASQVAPKKWTNIRVLFDDGKYSVIIGDFEGSPRIGERWNGQDGKLGFPNVSGYAVWHTSPGFLELPILIGCRDRLLKRPNSDSNAELIEQEIKLREAERQA